jgi:hypothetical protein
MSMSGVREDTKYAANGMMMTVRIIPANFPINTLHDGDPFHKTSSSPTDGAFATVIGAKPAGEGRPQCGQAEARVETSFPQSGQVTTGLEGL